MADFTPQELQILAADVNPENTPIPLVPNPTFKIPSRERAAVDEALAAAKPSDLRRPDPGLGGIDNAKVYDDMSAGFKTPREAREALTKFYSGYFNLKPSDTLESMRYSVHKKADDFSQGDYTTAIDDVKNMVRKVEVTLDPYHEALKTDSVQQSKDAYADWAKTQQPDRLTTSVLSGVGGVPALPSKLPSYEEMAKSDPLKLRELQQAYMAKLRRESPAATVRSLEPLFDKETVYQARIAAVSNDDDAVATLLAGAGDSASQLEQLIRTYRGVYDPKRYLVPLKLGHTLWAGTKGVVDVFNLTGRALGEMPEFGEGLRNLLASEFGNNFDKTLLGPDGQPKDEATKAKIQQSIYSYFVARAPMTPEGGQDTSIAQRRTDEIMRNIGEAISTSTSVHNQNKAEYNAKAALDQPVKAGPIGTQIYGFTRSVPDLAVMMALGPAAPAFMAATVSKDYYNDIYNRGYTPAQAGAKALPLVFANAVAGQILHQTILKPWTTGPAQGLLKGAKGETFAALLGTKLSAARAIVTRSAEEGLKEGVSAAGFMEIVSLTRDATNFAAERAFLGEDPDAIAAVKAHFNGTLDTLAQAFIFGGIGALTAGAKLTVGAVGIRNLAGDPVKLENMNKALAKIGVHEPLAAEPKAEAKVAPEVQAGRADIVTQKAAEIHAEEAKNAADERALLDKNAPLGTVAADEGRPAVRSLVEKILNQITGDVPVKWYPNVEALRKATGWTVSEGVEGAYHNGAIHLVEGNLSDSLHAMLKFAHESGHFGLARLHDALDLPSLYDYMAKTLKSEGMLRYIVESGGDPMVYGSYSDAAMANEYLGRLSEKVVANAASTLPPSELTVWQKIQKHALDSLGYRVADRYHERELAQFMRGVLKETWFPTEARNAAIDKAGQLELQFSASLRHSPEEDATRIGHKLKGLVGTLKLMRSDAATRVSDAIFKDATDRLDAIYADFAANSDAKAAEKAIDQVSKDMVKAMDALDVKLSARVRPTTGVIAHAGITTARDGVADPAKQAELVKSLRADGYDAHLSEGNFATTKDGKPVNYPEPTVFNRLVVPTVADLAPHFEKLQEHAKAAEQDATHLSYEVLKKHPNARRGLELSFTRPLQVAELKAVLDTFGAKNSFGFTVAVNKAGEVIGLDTQYVPEYAGDKIEDVAVNMDRWFQHAKEAAQTAPAGLISSIHEGYYSTHVVKKGQYGKVPFADVMKNDIAAELARQPQLSAKPADAAEREKIPGERPDGMVPLTRWGNTNRTQGEMDPAFHGAGIRAAERVRREDHPELYIPRLYFGLEGYVKEEGLGPHKHTISVPADSLYDWTKDPRGYRDTAAAQVRDSANEIAPMDRGAMISIAEKMIKDAGYLGYYAGDVAAVFEKVPGHGAVEWPRTRRLTLTGAPDLKVIPEYGQHYQVLLKSDGQNPLDFGHTFFLSPAGEWIAVTSGHAEAATELMTGDANGRGLRHEDQLINEHGYLRIVVDGDTIYADGSKITAAQRRELTDNGISNFKSAIFEQRIPGQKTRDITIHESDQPQFAAAPTDADRISQRFPTGAGATEDPIADPSLKIDTEVLKSNPEQFAKSADLLREYPNVKARANARPETVVDAYTQMGADNLTWLYNKLPAVLRERAVHWYRGARKLGNEWADEYNHPARVIAGVIAALSPQKDWYQNVSLAKRVLGTYKTHQNTAFDEKMAATGKRISGKSPTIKALLSDLQGKTLGELPTQILKAAWIRIYDETYNPSRYQALAPEGHEIGWSRTRSGGYEKRAWGSLDTIRKAISMIENPDIANISREMGQQHKIRNFYTNQMFPEEAGSAVTIDTHAVAALNLRPLAAADATVSHNFGGAERHAVAEDSPLFGKQEAEYVSGAPSSSLTGASGTYGINADAYRIAAERLGIPVQKLQSVTWEGIRAMFPAEAKTKLVKKFVDGIWTEYSKGRITANEAREKIWAAIRFQLPQWARGDGLSGGAQDTGYTRELFGSDVPRQSAGETVGGGGSGSAGPVPSRVDLSARPVDARRQGEAAVELAFRTLKGEDLTGDKGKEFLKKNYPGVVADKALATAARLSALVDPAKAATPADLVHELRLAEIDAAVQDRVTARLADVHKKAYVQGAFDAELKTRIKAEDQRRNMEGADFLKADEKIPEMEQIIRDAYKSGRQAGIQSATPFETLLSNAIDKKDGTMRFASKASRQGAYETDLARILGVLEVSKSDPARGIDFAIKQLAEMFGPDMAKSLRANARGSVEGLFTKMQKVYEDRLASLWANDLVANLVKPPNARANLTPDAQAKFDEVVKQYKFPLDMVAKGLAAAGKMKMAQQLADAGKLSPAEFNAKAELVRGYKMGLANYFKEMPFGEVADLHAKVSAILAESAQDKFENQKAKAEGKSLDAAKITAEVQAGAETVFGEGERTFGGRPWFKGKVTDTNLALDTFAQLWGGGKRDSHTFKVLRADPIAGENAARLMEHQVKDSFWKKARELGFTESDVLARWRYDRRRITIGNGHLLVTTGELMDLYNQVKDPMTQVEFGRTEALKSAVDRVKQYGVSFKDTAEAVDQITSLVNRELTPEQRKLADHMFDALHDPVMVNALNAVSYWRSGTHEFVNPNYWPLSRDASAALSRTDSESLASTGGRKTKSLESIGYAIRRVSNKRPIMYQDAVEKFFDHVGDVSRGANLTIPISNAKAALRNRDVFQAISERFGEAGIRNVVETYDKMGGMVAADPNSAKRLLRVLEHNVMLTTMWARLPSFLKARAGGGIMMATELGGRYGADTSARFYANIGLPSKLFWTSQANVEARNALFQNGYFAHRFQDHPVEVFSQTFRPGMEDAKDPEILQKFNKLGEAYGIFKVYRKRAEALGMNPLMEADLKTAVSAYRALREKGLSQSDAVAAVEDMISATQPASRAGDETVAYRTLRPLWLIFPFLGAPSRAAAMLKRDTMRLNLADLPAEKAAAAKQLAFTALGVTAQVISAALISRIVYSVSTGKPFIPDEDNKKVLASARLIAEASDSLFPGSGRLLSLATSAATKGDIGELSIAERPINDIGMATLTLMKAHDNDALDMSDEKVQHAVAKLVESAATLSRIPLAGPLADLRIVKGIISPPEE